jgi:hypothetical protein
MDSFPGDYYGHRCRSGKKSSDIFNDYLDLLDGVACAEYELNWQLNNDATAEEFESWEHHMLQGFYRCATYDHNLDNSTRLALAVRRVDGKLYSWWHKAMWEKCITSAAWANFRKFIRECLIPSSTAVPCPQSRVTMDVGKTIAPLPKTATAVTTHSQDKLAKVDIPNKVAAMSIPSHATEATVVVPVQTVSVVVPKPSEEKQPVVTKVVVCAENTVEEVEPLSGLNMQLKWVCDWTCKPVDKGQHWSLFQTQCMVKGKACKLMVDGGSYYNGISKAVVATLGLSTWRIPEPKLVAWLNSCGMLKITHKVRMPFTVGDYVDEVECDVLPLEVCGLLLGRPWQYDRNVTHARRANTYYFVHDRKHRTLKPMQDDQIKFDVELVVHKEKLHKAKPKSGLATLQPEEHDAWSVSVAIVSAVPVDDKPVILISDKPVEVKPLLDKRTYIAACSIVCVDKGVQTDAPCADHVSVQNAAAGGRPQLC